MSRQARQKSQSGIYHIILRGINKQVIFEDEEDRQMFLACLQHYQAICQYAIYGYCLMDNHIHLLIKEREETVGSFMKRIGVRYVSWYNRKYNRCGHLFQDRFKSEVVESDEYLLTVLRYIQQNPLAAGLVKTIEESTVSSYGEYIDGYKVIDGDFVLGIFSEDKERALKLFQKFMRERVKDAGCLEVQDKVALTDEDVRELIQARVNVKTPVALQAMEKSERDEALRNIKQMPGVTTRQIARLTGISQSVISRA